MLDGIAATSHWLALDLLAKFGADADRERVVERGKVITAAGVSSGIDMALTLAGRIAGPDVAQAIQLVDRVRPAAAVRRRLPGQGAAGDRRARPRRRASENA